MLLLAPLLTAAGEADSDPVPGDHIPFDAQHPPVGDELLWVDDEGF